MKPEETERLATLAASIAKEAAEFAWSGFRTGAKIDRKQGTELVTRFDLETEQIIRERLHQAVPNISVVAEEMGGESRGDCVWFVDPIDGTTNFAHGHPFWCVSIGLVVRGIPVVGAVHAPALGLEWLGWQGGPALRNGQPCYVSEIDFLGDALLATGFPYDRQTSPDNNVDAFALMQKHAVGIRRCGSAALDLCLVADGTYDGYWEKKLRPWDIAAGLAIVCAAGGTTTCMDGGTLDLQQGHVAASNGRVHEGLLQVLRESKRLKE